MFLHQAPGQRSVADLGQPAGATLPEVVEHEKRRRWVRFGVAGLAAAGLGASALMLRQRDAGPWKRGAALGGGAALGLVIGIGLLGAIAGKAEG